MPTKIIEKKDRVKLTRNLIFEMTKEADDRLVIDFTYQKKDRDNEVLLIDGCDLREYRKNMIIQADHSWSIRSTVGSFQWLQKYPKKKPDRIRGLPRFATTPFARDVETLVKEKHVKAISHTFEGFEYTEDLEDIKQLGIQYGFDSKGVVRVYLKWAPLEISFVVVQSNTDAWAHLVSEGKIKSKIFKDMIKKAATGEKEDEKIIYICSECGHEVESEGLDKIFLENIKCPECDGEMRLLLKEDLEEEEPESEEDPKEDSEEEPEEEETEDLYSEENLEKSLKGNLINTLMDLLAKIKKHTEEAEILAKSISETDQGSQPGPGDQSAEEEEMKTAIVVDSIKRFKRR